MQPMKIAPSILSADFSRLKDEIQAVEAGGADWLHVDVMDGHFVPNITIGPVVVEWVRKVTTIPVDVHLMITDPDKYAPEFIKAGADWISVHPDTCANRNATLNKIRELGAKTVRRRESRCAVKQSRRLPHRHRDALDDDGLPWLRRSGFYPGCFTQDRRNEKTRSIRESLPILIEVDGGIKVDNIDRVVRCRRRSDRLRVRNLQNTELLQIPSGRCAKRSGSLDQAVLRQSQSEISIEILRSSISPRSRSCCFLFSVC